MNENELTRYICLDLPSGMSRDGSLSEKRRKELVDSLQEDLMKIKLPCHLLSCFIALGGE